MELDVRPEGSWLAAEAAHAARVVPWIDPHLERRRRGERHPVADFLFDYYSLRPAQLRRWHPGIGVVLAGPAATERLGWKWYAEAPDGVAADVAGFVEQRADSIEWIRGLLAATASRPPRLTCFGMHEWAMVYRQRPEEIRHSSWPLRLGEQGVAAVVDGRPPACTHFDAFRFFTPAARPLNAFPLVREDQAASEQPGCLHATMDLYKWAYKLSPLTPSELLADCFALARDVREVDMRASPYDFAALGLAPITIETPTGRTEYAAHQRDFAARAAPLRAALSDICDRALRWDLGSGRRGRSRAGRGSVRAL